MSKHNHHHPSQRKDVFTFTPGFFKFLLWFVIIVFFGFGGLFLLGIKTMPREPAPNPSPLLAPKSSTPSSQLAQ